MKAVQVKYMGATDRRGARLKAWSESGHISEPLDYGQEIGEQARQLAKHYIEETWHGVEINGFGVLPCGDWVATIRAKELID